MSRLLSALIICALLSIPCTATGQGTTEYGFEYNTSYTWIAEVEITSDLVAQDTRTHFSYKEIVEVGEQGTAEENYASCSISVEYDSGDLEAFVSYFDSRNQTSIGIRLGFPCIYLYHFSNIHPDYIASLRDYSTGSQVFHVDHFYTMEDKYYTARHNTVSYGGIEYTNYTLIYSLSTGLLLSWEYLGYFGRFGYERTELHTKVLMAFETLFIPPYRSYLSSVLSLVALIVLFVTIHYIKKYQERRLFLNK